MKATPHRRQVIVAVLLALAIAGAGMRQWADNPSLARDIGTLLLVLWLPAVGNIVAFAIGRWRAAHPQRPPFNPAAAFQGHLLVELARVGPAGAGAMDAGLCTLVVGREGFTARLAQPLALWLTGPQPAVLQVQLLRPTLALPRLPLGAVFSVLAGTRPVGTGRVLEVQRLVDGEGAG
ncbi:MAG: hypothetical protein ACYC0T_03885 [Ramlibacter sp.]